MELWKDIKGYEGLYQVSNEGNVRSVDRIVQVERNGSQFEQCRKGRIIRQLARRHGYLAVFLYKDGERIQVSVHRLVAEAFCEKKQGATEVNHKNEIKTDNRAENLEWVTHKENTNYGTAQQRRSEKTRNNERSTPIRQKTLDGEVVKEYPSIAEAFRQTGCGKGNIHKCLKGTYSHAYGYKWEYVNNGNNGESLL